MLMEGLKLMAMGMVTVFLFLTIMVFLIQVITAMTRNATAKELAELEEERKQRALAQKKKKKAGETTGTGIPPAVFAAAIAAYEADRVT